MKTIITLDKADQPYGFPQLDANSKLNASGSFSGSFTGDLQGSNLSISDSAIVSGSLIVSGSITLNNLLTLTPQHPLPLGVATGSFAVSSSIPPKPYFYDGTTWNALY